MCPHQNGDAAPADKSEMVNVPLTNGAADGKRGSSSTNAHSIIEQQKKNPYAPRASDFLSNVSNFNIIESTLRGASITRLPPSHPLTPRRGRAVRQRLLRHQDQDRHRQGARCVRCRVHRAHLARRVRAVARGLRGDLQARAQGQDPHPHPLPHGRRAHRRRDRRLRR